MKKRYIVSIAVGGAALILWLLGRFSVNFADWYAINIFPYLSGILSHITGLFPFSVGELVIFLFILGVFAGGTLMIIGIVRNKGKRLRIFLDGFSWLTSVCSVIFLLLTLNCFINYNRLPFSAYSGLELSTYSADELRLLAEEIVENINVCSDKIEVDENNICVSAGDFRAKAAEAMNSLAEDYSVLNVYFPQPKPVIMSEFMSMTEICGVYYPFTVEANYNNNMPDSEKGLTVCHELSHLTGFMREDEANFVAFLACRKSDSAYLNYCGYYTMLKYVLNAYYPVATAERYSELYGRLSAQVKAEMQNSRDYWSAYEQTVVAEVSAVVNDTYLKANNQTDGEKSYGRVVDLLIADYLERNAA